jgi:hypothetical protein
MNRIIAALALPTLLLAAAPAAAAERRYPVTDFTKVQVEGPYEVVLRTGLPSAARAEGSQQALERVSVDVLGSTLRVRPNRSAWGGYPGQNPGPVRVELSTRDLRGAMVVGSGSLSVDRARGLRLDLSLSGNGRLTVGAVEADTLAVGLVGGGRIAAAGKAKQLRATVQGSGDFDAPGLVADDAQLFAETTGAVAFTANRSAKVRATGAGDVAIGGAAACEVEARGAGRVTCGR